MYKHLSREERYQIQSLAKATITIVAGKAHAMLHERQKCLAVGMIGFFEQALHTAVTHPNTLWCLRLTKYMGDQILSAHAKVGPKILTGVTQSKTIGA